MLVSWSRPQIIGLAAALFLTNVGNFLASTDVLTQYSAPLTLKMTLKEQSASFMNDIIENYTL